MSITTAVKKNALNIDTQADSKYRIQLELETSLGKEFIEDNGYSFIKINNVA